MALFSTTIAKRHIYFGLATLLDVCWAYNAFNKGNTEEGIYLSLAGIGLVIAWILADRYNNRCPQCGKWGVMKHTREELVDQEPTTKSKHVTRNGVSYDIEVPATQFTYHFHRKCKECGFEDYVVREKVEEHR